MKKCKNRLDEMQEKKLLQIEHTCFWICFWGLFVVIYAQIAVGNGGFENIGGECLILSAASIYLLIGCIKNGIWDRQLKPNFKTNLIISLMTSFVFGGFWFIVSYHNYRNLVGSIATFVFMAISIFIIALILLSISLKLYQKKVDKLNEKAEQDENED